MEYLVIKTVHIMSAILLFGTGLGSAFYKYMADRSGQLPVIAVTNGHVVLADWLITTPTIVIQPVTGLWMAHLTGVFLHAPWLVVAVVLYLIAGACWLPVVFLQIRMRNDARESFAMGRPLPARYWRDARRWIWLGVPAFSSMLVMVGLMVFKPAWP